MLTQSTVLEEYTITVVRDQELTLIYVSGVLFPYIDFIGAGRRASSEILELSTLEFTGHLAAVIGDTTRVRKLFQLHNLLRAKEETDGW